MLPSISDNLAQLSGIPEGQPCYCRAGYKNRLRNLAAEQYRTAQQTVYNGLEGAPQATMVELYGFDLGRIKRNNVLSIHLPQQVLFVDEQEFGLWIKEPLNQPTSASFQ